MTKPTPEDVKAAERIAQSIRAACLACGGSGGTGGPAPPVTRDMALDAGDPSLEGGPSGPDTSEECEYCGRPMRAVIPAIASAIARARAAPEDSPDLKAKYMELIMAVARKWPGENRHETALRYIREAENTSNAVAARANTQRKP